MDNVVELVEISCHFDLKEVFFLSKKSHFLDYDRFLNKKVKTNWMINIYRDSGCI